MTIVARSATEQLGLYRLRHRIEIDPSGDWTTCETDGLRVHMVRGNQWRHDADQIARLEKAAAREDLDRGVVTVARPGCYFCGRSLEDGLYVRMDFGRRIGVVDVCDICEEMRDDGPDNTAAGHEHWDDGR